MIPAKLSALIQFLFFFTFLPTYEAECINALLTFAIFL